MGRSMRRGRREGIDTPALAVAGGAVAVLAIFVGASVGAASSPSPVAMAPGLPVFAADEPLLLATRGAEPRGEIVVWGTDGVRIPLATDLPPGFHKHPTWSPDGQHVAFIDGTTERLWIAHLDGSPTESVPVCDTPGCDYPAWSPDGSRIAYSRYENADSVEGPSALGIHVVDLETGASTPVVRLERPLLADRPRWSPDGMSIAFGVDRMDEGAWETGAAVAVVPVTGGEPRFLTDFEAFGYAPDWNWVTGELVYGVSARMYIKDIVIDGETWDIFGIQPDGSGLRQITHAGPGDRFRGPVWTPDGTAISAYHDGSGSGVLVDPTTGEYRSLDTRPDEIRPFVRPLPGDAG